MKLRMLDSESTRIDGKAHHFIKGQEYEIPNALGEVWVQQGLAETVGATTVKAQQPPKAKEEE